MHTGFVYMMTNKTRTALYVGVTNSLLRRTVQHRLAEVPGFTARYHVNRLVYFESFACFQDAINREKQIKGWTRAKKEALIAVQNPEGHDLAESVLGLEPAPETVWCERGGWQRQDPSLHSG